MNNENMKKYLNVVSNLNSDLVIGQICIIPGLADESDMI